MPAAQANPASGFGGGGQQHVAGIAADGDHRAGVGADRYRDVAENLTELIELLEIDDTARRRRRVHRDIAAAALRNQRDAQDLDADQSPSHRTDASLTISGTVPDCGVVVPEGAHGDEPPPQAASAAATQRTRHIEHRSFMTLPQLNFP